MSPRGPLRLAAALTLAGALVTACTEAPPQPVTSASGHGGGAASTPRLAPSSTTRGAATPSPTPQPLPDTLTLAFAGDVNFEGRVRRLLDSADGLVEVTPLVGAADLAVVNFESAITDRGVEEPKLYHFRASPMALEVLDRAGFDVVSMANNHAVDYGALGLTDTLAAIDSSPVPVIGLARNAAKAFAPSVHTIGGVRVAVIASTQVNDLTVNKYPATDTRAGVAGNLDNTRLLAAVRAARARYDVVVVFLHWGIDYTECPDGAQVATARALAAAGADVVVGGHAHRVQGAGWLGRTYVGYGLGNFVWLNTRGDIDKHSGVLTLTVDAKAARALRGANATAREAAPALVRSARWTPLMVSDVDGIPRAPDATKAAALLADWTDNRRCARLASAPPR